MRRLLARAWAHATPIEFEDALWTVCAHPGLDVGFPVVCALDRDTLGAIVGGIVACAVGLDGIPLMWRESIERLPEPAMLGA